MLLLLLIVKVNAPYTGCIKLDVWCEKIFHPFNVQESKKSAVHV